MKMVFFLGGLDCEQCAEKDKIISQMSNYIELLQGKVVMVKKK